MQKTADLEATPVGENKKQHYHYFFKGMTKQDVPSEKTNWGSEQYYIAARMNERRVTGKTWNIEIKSPSEVLKADLWCIKNLSNVRLIYPIEDEGLMKIYLRLKKASSEEAILKMIHKYTNYPYEYIKVNEITDISPKWWKIKGEEKKEN